MRKQSQSRTGFREDQAGAAGVLAVDGQPNEERILKVQRGAVGMPVGVRALHGKSIAGLTTCAR